MPRVTTRLGTRSTVTMRPLATPAATPTSVPITKPDHTGMWWYLNRSPTMYADRPSTEPTDRSTLRVMITSVSPTPSSANREAPLSICWMLLLSTKCGFFAVVMMTTNAMRTRMPTSRARSSAITTPPPLPVPLVTVAVLLMSECSCSEVRVLAGGRPHDGVLVRLVPGEFGREPALTQHQHPVGHPQHLREFGGDHQHGQPAGHEFVEDPVHLGLGPDVDTAGRLVDDEQLRPAGQPLAQHDLLLVPARQGQRGVAQSAELDLQPGRPGTGQPSLARAEQ